MSSEQLIFNDQAEIDQAVAFLAKQLATCRNLLAANNSKSAPLVGAENFYLDRMECYVKSHHRYLKYNKLRKVHKEAVKDAKLLFGIDTIDRRLDLFAEEHFDYYAYINNSKYTGPFGSPASRQTSPVLVRFLRGTRIW